MPIVGAGHACDCNLTNNIYGFEFNSTKLMSNNRIAVLQAVQITAFNHQRLGTFAHQASVEYHQQHSRAVPKIDFV